MNKKRYRTDFLFSTSTFLSGAGTVFNIAGNYYGFNSSESKSEADERALNSDWHIVGQDIEEAVNQLKKEINDGQLELDFNE